MSLSDVPTRDPRAADLQTVSLVPAEAEQAGLQTPGEPAHPPAQHPKPAPHASLSNLAGRTVQVSVQEVLHRPVKRRFWFVQRIKTNKASVALHKPPAAVLQ